VAASKLEAATAWKQAHVQDLGRSQIEGGSSRWRGWLDNYAAVSARARGIPPRRVLVAFLSAAPYLLLGLLYLGALTSWTWDIAYFDRLSLGAAYDSLAESLLRGEAVVDRRLIGPEAFIEPQGVVMYFGIFPALLRVLANGLCPSMWGRWTALSTALACVLAVWGAARAARIALRVNPSLSDRQRVFLRWALWLTAALGSPLVHLVAATNIYFESIAWAFAGAVVALSFVAEALLEGDLRGRTMLGFGLSATAAALARPTYGAPLWLVSGLLLYLYFRRPVAERPWQALAALTGTLLATLLVLGWYNSARWGAPLTFMDLTSYVQRQGYDFVLAQGQWNHHRLPTTFFNYFSLTPSHFLSEPPYVRLVQPTYLHPAYFPSFRQGLLSIPVSAPWLLSTALVGVVLAIRRGSRAIPLVALALLASQIAFIGGFYHIAHRYSLEMYPTIVFAHLLFLACVRPPKRARVAALVVTLLVLLSVATNCLSQVHWLLHESPQTPAALGQLLQTYLPG